jgi:hypothetical protein
MSHKSTKIDHIGIMRSWGIEINDSQGVVGKGFLIRGWNNPWLYPPAVRQVIRIVPI